MRDALLPGLAKYAERLAEEANAIDDRHRQAAGQLGEWIIERIRAGEAAPVICVCTGNSRRSVFGAAMGNVAAVYWNLPGVRFFSGGTAPSAVDHRTLAALEEVGFEVEATGDGGASNPNYVIRWGHSGSADGGIEMKEFSKHFGDPSNPQAGFAALMVCGEADEGCPLVAGAAVRISLPFSDPKEYDGTPLERRKYAERRDEIGRVLFAAAAAAKRHKG